MVVAGAATCDADGVPASVRRAISDALHARLRAIEQHLERATRERQLPPSADTSALALFYSTVHAGLVVQAQDRRCSRGLKKAVSAAMAAWPCPRSGPEHQGRGPPRAEVRHKARVWTRMPRVFAACRRFHRPSARI
jgi:hypothetical protein